MISSWPIELCLNTLTADNGICYLLVVMLEFGREGLEFDLNFDQGDYIHTQFFYTPLLLQIGVWKCTNNS